MEKKLKWACMLLWASLLSNVQGSANSSESAINPIQAIQALSSEVITAANSSLNTPNALLPPPLPRLPPLPWSRSNATAALAADAVLTAEAPAPGVAADIAEATLASAPAPELAALLQNLTAAAPAPAPSPAALSPLPLTAPAAAALRSFQAAAGGSSSGNATEQPLLALPARTNVTSMTESKAIGNLVASSVQLGADLAASGHAVSFAAEERASFAAKLKGDFEALSLAIANLPVGLIPFPDKAKAALQKLNTDVVHGVTSGNLDVAAISADKDAVAAALAPVTGGATVGDFEKLQ